VLAALVAELDLNDSFRLFAWSDATNQDHVVSRLHAAATSIRQRSGAPTDTTPGGPA
jgi:hypothetical protein